MKVFFTVFLSLLSYNIYSCSCNWVYPFCYTYGGNENVIIAKVIDTTDNSIIVVIEELLRGNENRDTINIWDNTLDTSQCQFKHKATNIGHPGSRIVVILVKIDSILNPWDVIGDYRRPYSLCNEYWLTIANDSVYGYVNGAASPQPPPSDRTYKWSFNDFITTLKANSGCTYLSSKEYDKEVKIKILQTVDNQIHISVENNALNTARIFSANGKLVHSSSFRESSIINIHALTKGIYLIQVENSNGDLLTSRIQR